MCGWVLSVSGSVDRHLRVRTVCFGCLLVACDQRDDSHSPSARSCSDTTELGTWWQEEPLTYSAHLMTPLAVSVGDRLLVFGTDGLIDRDCDLCVATLLDPTLRTWTDPEVLGGEVGSLPEFALLEGSPNHVAAYSETSGEVFLLDLESKSWASLDLPEEVRLRSRVSHVRWDGSRFVFFQRLVPEDEILSSTTSIRVQYDGFVVDPILGEVSLIPGAWVESSHLYGENDPFGQVRVAVTEKGLLVVSSGTEFEGFRMALLNSATLTWSDLSSDDAPPPRAYFALASSGEDVYLFGGRTLPFEAEVRDLWRYSLRFGDWDEVELAAYTDTSGVGAWAGDCLVLSSRSCSHWSAYCPEGAPWRALGDMGGPPPVFYLAGFPSAIVAWGVDSDSVPQSMLYGYSL